MNTVRSARSGSPSRRVKTCSLVAVFLSPARTARSTLFIGTDRVLPAFAKAAWTVSSPRRRSTFDHVSESASAFTRKPA